MQGTEIHITINFWRDTYVTTTGGTPFLDLETGVVDGKAIYHSGSGSKMINFVYTVW